MLSARIAVIVPCYNTSRTSMDVIRQALTIVDAVLAVNDGSTDDTAAHLDESGARCLHLPENRGKGVALRAGIEEVLKGPSGMLAAPFEYIVTLDGDGQHNPKDIPRLYDCARRSSADLVIGGRNVSLMPPKSKFGNRFSRDLFQLATGVFVPDTQSGFRLMSTPLARALLDVVRWRRYETEFDILFRTVALGFRIETVEIPTIYFDENRGSHFNPFRDSMRVFAVTSRYLFVRFTRNKPPLSSR